MSLLQHSLGNIQPLPANIGYRPRELGAATPDNGEDHQRHTRHEGKCLHVSPLGLY